MSVRPRNHTERDLAQRLQSEADIMIPCCFAIIPDRSHQPLAMFSDLQDAMDWGLKRLGGDSFRIKYISIARVEREEEPAATDDPATFEEAAEEAMFTGPRLLS